MFLSYTHVPRASRIVALWWFCWIIRSKSCILMFWQDSFVSATWFIHGCEMSVSSTLLSNSLCLWKCVCVSACVHKCGCVWVRVHACVIHECDMSYSDMWVWYARLCLQPFLPNSSCLWKFVFVCVCVCVSVHVCACVWLSIYVFWRVYACESETTVLIFRSKTAQTTACKKHCNTLQHAAPQCTTLQQCIFC